VKLRNISKVGALFVSDQRLLEGDLIEITLGDGLRVRGFVVRSEAAFDDCYAIGVRFESSAPRARDEEEIGNADLVGELYQLELQECNDEVFEYYPRLKRVRDFVIERFDETISLAQAADVAAMERTYFSSFFHEKVGVTFRDWLQYLRISRAMKIISQQDHSITEVAFAVGFNELSTFQKAFKRWTSLTPRDFKRLARPA
jgi:AraC-like DNA-binding protein